MDAQHGAPFWGQGFHAPPPPSAEAFWAAAAAAAAAAAFHGHQAPPPPPMWFPVMHGFPALMPAAPAGASSRTFSGSSVSSSTAVDSSGGSSVAVSSSSSPLPLQHGLLAPPPPMVPSGSFLLPPLAGFAPPPPVVPMAPAPTFFRPSLAALAEAAAVSRGETEPPSPASAAPALQRHHSSHDGFSPITTVGLKKAASSSATTAPSSTAARRRQRLDSNEGDGASSGGGSSEEHPTPSSGSSSRRKTARTHDDNDDFVAPPQHKNRRVPTAKTSLFRGVSRCGKDQKFQARIRLGQNVIYLGRFRTELEAALRYDDAVRHYSSAERHLWVDATNFREMTEEEKDLVLKDFLAHGQELREEMYSYLQPSTLKKLKGGGAA